MSTVKSLIDEALGRDTEAGEPLAKQLKTARERLSALEKENAALQRERDELIDSLNDRPPFDCDAVEILAEWVKSILDGFEDRLDFEDREAKHAAEAVLRTIAMGRRSIP